MENNQGGLVIFDSWFVDTTQKHDFYPKIGAICRKIISRKDNIDAYRSEIKYAYQRGLLPRDIVNFVGEFFTTVQLQINDEMSLLRIYHLGSD